MKKSLYPFLVMLIAPITYAGGFTDVWLNPEKPQASEHEIVEKAA